MLRAAKHVRVEMRPWVVVAVLCACGSASPRSSPSHVAKHEPVPSQVSDSDKDGLCDTTEQQLGTDPLNADTDGDGVPDLIEIGNGFDPGDPAAPASDQVAELVAQPGGSLDFAIRTTADGDGQGRSGLFQAIPSIYGDRTSADDFFTGALAVSAEPMEAVRRIDTASAHFISVLGRTRLTFALHFEYLGHSGGMPDCARAYPFRYGVRADDGTTRSTRLYLLVVVPSGQGGAAVDYCLPIACQ